MRKTFGALCGLALLALLGQAAAAQESIKPRFEPLDACFLEIPDSTAHDCGYLVVPEFHDQSSDKSFKLAVVRLLSTSKNPKDPIFFGTGGPGGSGFTVLEIGALSDNDGYYAQLLANHDLVFFSQRGTPFADPYLPCFEVNGIDEKYLSSPPLIVQTVQFGNNLFSLFYPRPVSE